MKTPLLIRTAAFALAGFFAAESFAAKLKPIPLRPSPPPLQDDAVPGNFPDARWDAVRNEPSTLEVTNVPPSLLLPGKGKEKWTTVPREFSRYRAVVFQPAQKQAGFVDYRVTAGGYLFVACNFANQGNKAGGWQENLWTKADFLAHGWREIPSEELGGPLIKGGSREQVIFLKKVAAGESGRMRCNKYDPPYFIVWSNDPAP